MRKKLIKSVSLAMAIIMMIPSQVYPSAATVSSTLANRTVKSVGENNANNSTKISFGQSKLYAGVQQTVIATTEGGEDCEIPYKWSIILNDSTDITNESIFQYGAKGYDTNGHLYQYGTFTVPIKYAGEGTITVCAKYWEATNDANSTKEILTPVTNITNFKEDKTLEASPEQAHYDVESNTLYVDRSEIVDKKETHEVALTFETDSLEDSVAVSLPPGIECTSKIDGKKNSLVFVSKDDGTSSKTVTIHPSSGYKTSKNINFVTGIEAEEMELVASGGYFADNVSVLDAHFEKNELVVNQSGIVIQEGENVSINAKLSPGKTNDTIRYTLYDNGGKYVRTLTTNDEKGCVLQINDPGTYSVKAEAVSVGDGCLKRRMAGTFLVVTKTANPITRITSTIKELTISTKEFTTKDGISYVTSGRLSDYITFAPEDYLDIIEYSSDNEKLVKIDANSNFKVVPNTEGGKTKLWAKSKIGGASCYINVTVHPATNILTIKDPEYPILPAGHGQQLSVNVTPNNSVEEITWTSTNPDILSVTENGYIKTADDYTGDTVAVTIKATSSSGVTAQIPITVCKAIRATETEMTLSAIKDNDVYKTDDNVYDIYYGDEAKVICELKTDSGEESNDIIKWLVESSGVNEPVENYLTVSEKGDNYIVFKNNAKSKIALTAYVMKAGQEYSEATIIKSIVLNPIVKTKSINLGDKNRTVVIGTEQEIEAKLNSTSPYVATTDIPVFVTSNPNVLEIEQNGSLVKVKAVGTGVATLTCYTCYDPNNIDCKRTAEAKMEFLVLDKTDITNNISVKGLKDVIYNGEPTKLSLEVTYNNKRLKENKDYICIYESNVDKGVAYVTVSGIGDYTGGMKYEYNILANDMSKCSIDMEGSHYYTGKEIKPEIVVKVNRKTLNKNDYSVSYIDNIYPGKATITVTGKGNYSGTATKTFTIKQTPIKNSTLKMNESAFSYNEKEHRPSINVAYNNLLLVENIDYTLEYKNNINAGTAKVKVIGIGGYTGEKEIEFKIQKGKKTIESSSSITKTSNTKYFRLNVRVPEGEEVTYSLSNDKVISLKGDVATVKAPGKVTVTITSKESKNYLAATKKITVTITSAITKPKVTKFTYSKSKKSKTISLKWKKTTGISGYQIQYGTNAKFKKAKSVTLSSKTTSKTLKSLKKKKTYYIRIRTYKKVSGKKYYSSWSSVKKIKCK